MGGVTSRREPLEVTVPASVAQSLEEGATPSLSVSVEFQGHYNEPVEVLRCPVGQTCVYDLSYDVSGVHGGWSSSLRE